MVPIIQFCIILQHVYKMSQNLQKCAFLMNKSIYNITVIKMWPNEGFVDNCKGLSWKNI